MVKAALASPLSNSTRTNLGNFCVKIGPFFDHCDPTFNKENGPISQLDDRKQKALLVQGSLREEEKKGGN